jgi:hypothetical protein
MLPVLQTSPLHLQSQSIFASVADIGITGQHEITFRSDSAGKKKNNL